MLLSCGEKVVCLQLKPRVSIRSSKCYIKGLKLPENQPKNENILSFPKMGWRSFLTCQNAGAIFRIALQPTKANYFATVSLMTGFQKRKSAF